MTNCNVLNLALVAFIISVTLIQRTLFNQDVTSSATSQETAGVSRRETTREPTSDQEATTLYPGQYLTTHESIDKIQASICKSEHETCHLPQECCSLVCDCNLTETVNIRKCLQRSVPY